MKYIFLAATTLFFSKILVAQNAPKPYWQQQVNYNIAVSLNDEDHTIDALEKIVYTNNSPDTLTFIWFHIWANAYKNDKTAFSEQLLQNGRTDFYFSDEKGKGYTSKLNFKVNDEKAIIASHPQHIDIVKLLLPKPLPPNKSITIETPFHTKLPYNFSRGGHIENDYQLTQWYPKPAVYDSKGWHEMPYLDQGEFYSEFGSFEVSITIPNDYLVAATGELQTTSELDLLKKLGQTNINKQPNYLIEDIVPEKNIFLAAKPIKKNSVIKTNNLNVGTKTLLYKQDNIHDFAWFASKNFLIQYDTLQLNNKVVDCFSFISKRKEKRCENNIRYIKNTLKNYSRWLGEYPYNVATVVVGKQNKEDGMEYPTITYINIEDSSWMIRDLISHELGHNWFYGILASNEREHPWMDEGMNSYYDNRWIEENRITDPKILATIPQKYQSQKNDNPNAGIETIFNSLLGIHKNIAIDTNAVAYPKEYYGLLVYEKAAYWLKKLEQKLGQNVFDSVMKTYYQQWKFKHPYPQNFKTIIEQVSAKNIDDHFAKLYNNKPFTNPIKKQFKVGLLLPTNNASKFNSISISPIVSGNYYDGIRLGIAMHNYQLPLPKFQFVVNPSYGTNSKDFNFFGRASHNIYSKKYWLEFATSYQQYTYNNFRPYNTNEQYFLSINRFVPSIKYTIYKKDLRSTERTVIGFKTFYLNTQNLNYTSKDTNNFTQQKSYINRLYIEKFDNRILYPYHINLTIDQGEDFVRAAFTAKQFFNYAKSKGGIEARFFAGKFFYLNGKTILKQIKNDKYYFNLSGPKGNEDYTYSDYFVGRGEFEGSRNQQIMERDGFFKVRTDLLGNKIGKTDDWLMAVNLNADIPNFPTLKIFADIGTYADAWKDNPATGKFLFDAGIQLSLLNNTVNIYAPIINSKIYRDYNKSTVVDKIFLKSISFSINLQNLRLNKLNRDIPL